MPNAEDVEKVKKDIQKLEEIFKAEMQKEFAALDENIKRKVENAKPWEELVKTISIDMSKFAAFEKTDAAKAKNTLKEIEERLGAMPKELSLQTHEHMLFDERVSSILAGEHSPVWYYFYHPYSGSQAIHTHNEGGVTQGSCPVDLTKNEMNPRSYAEGAGSGITDDNSVTTLGWFWFYIPGWYIKKPGTIYVWPYFDIHGYYWVRANDGFWTSKEARTRLRMCTQLYQYYYSPLQCWTVLDKGGKNIDASERKDFTGWNSTAAGVLQVGAGDPVYALVKAELYSYTSGSGSHALLNFQTGVGNYIKIPQIAVSAP
jgi:hypothetical protein